MHGFLLSGAGNDFLALVEPAEPPAAETIRAWCTRGLSIGADGLFLLERVGDGARMRYWNADGQPAALCINGTRCAARLAFHLGWATGRIRVMTDAGDIEARDLGPHGIAATLQLPAGSVRPRTLEADGTEVHAWLVGVGVPHLVVPWEEPMERAPVATLGPLLRSHPTLAPAGANVDFVGYRGDHRLEIRSFERGVEGETLACGTGVLAAVATGLALRRVDLPVSALTLGGCPLRVEEATRAGRARRWILSGDARLLARLELSHGASSLPEPAGWREVRGEPRI